MVADLFSLLAQTASPKRGSRERANCAERFYREGNRERNERQPRRWKGQSGEKVGAAVGTDLFSLLVQTASPKGKPRKGELRSALLQRGKPRKERKTAVALERAKRGKGWCGGWSRPLQSACADSFPEGEAEKAGTIPRRAGIKIDEVYTHIRLRIRGNRFCKAIL